ncbi:MAG: agmatinase [Candidatus Eremiobacteraeota bacterium]|nr:agmatinase [Candidatus Eremiobacteraeota bacterium]MBC5828558.1 agmatinase [Candidatus Eremiobacteraeota bacterium]
MIGLPTDRNSSYLRGPAKAPKAIRAALFSDQGNAFTELGLNLQAEGVLSDAGDLSLTESHADAEVIASAISSQLDRDHRVLSLGGDHSVTFPIIQAYARKYAGLHIVQFDAHPDLYLDFRSNPNSHASPFARILEHGLARALVQIGIRTMTPPQRVVADRYDVKSFGCYELGAAANALPDGPVYVSIDMDALDPAFAPGVSHREPGGLSVREILELIWRLPGDIVGADIVELNPDEDFRGMSAAAASKFAKELIYRMAT